MAKDEIFNIVKDATVEELDVDPEKITLQTNIKDDLEADSLDLFEIINTLEDKLDIELDTDESLETVGAVVDFVSEQLAAKEK
ncbi:acyl carrier protein [Lactobacillus corticis]|uniref:Acyl carrier protein n=1 Tax=Lactobacillus corticis TaxID=2201249 RepID=A0A916VH24_9LACO|nr:acyl carrier protein [Lactobacillus corticis]GFZ26581.1 acyl carrier protein [Lactobacillus corticis]